MRTLDKANFKKDGYNTPWDTTTYINIYWKYLDDLTKKRYDRDIVTSDNKIVRVAVAQIWECNYKTGENLIKWEKNAAGEKTWDNVKIYFGEITKIAHSFQFPRQASDPNSSIETTSKKKPQRKKRKQTTRQWCLPLFSSNIKMNSTKWKRVTIRLLKWHSSQWSKWWTK